jgi:cobalamin biosynthesis protein CobT
MAAENISVQHSNVQTASFDLQNRSLTLPMWKDMDGYMYDLLCGHEVGHALDTPFDGWHHNVKNNQKIKSFLNVIEDARIEKRIKRKFPGLAKSFAQAYRDLFDRDFFGIKKIDDLNSLNLIDRLNIHFKLGAHVIVPFNDEEREFVRETANVEQWDDVVDIANRVYNYVKSNETDKVNSAQDLEDLLSDLKNALDDMEYTEDSGDEDSSDEESEEDSDGEESEETEDGFGGSSSEESEEDSDGEENENGSGGSAAQESSDEEAEENSESGSSARAGSTAAQESFEPTSVTDDIFRNREAELVSDGTGKVHMVTLPKPAPGIVVPVTKILALFEEEAHKKAHLETMVQKSVAAFNTRNKKYISLLVKEFEMRKNATEYARAQVARSGQLDTSKLFQYRVKNDLFRRVTTIGKGKSHAMQLVFDMSGSMSSIFRQTVDQILVLSAFCKRVNIPFEVYGFTDEQMYLRMTRREATWQNRGNTSFCEMRLVKFLSSDMSASLYRRAFNMMTVVAEQFSNYSCVTAMDWASAGFRLGGTPLIETTAAIRFLAEDFKNKTGVDHVNVIVMTDGEGNMNRVDIPNFHWQKDTVYVVDPITKERIKCASNHLGGSVEKLVHNALSVKGIKMIGYYMAENPRHIAYFPGLTAIEQATLRKTIKTDGYFATKNVVGFDKYYLMVMSTSDRADAMENVDASSKAKLRSAFKQMNLNKRANRALAANFAQEIAF